jgi:methanethiol S-methyltransferase
MEENVWSHYGQWGLVALWILIYGMFLAFIPFYKKSQRKPASVYLAFIIALAFEMFGLPLSLYFAAWAFGVTLPEGLFWGHTLGPWIGMWGQNIGIVMMLTGFVLVVLGWKEIYKRYWSKEEGKGELVTNGIYKVIRHPQYTGFWLVTLGLLCQWATIPLLLMYPALLVMYYRLARKEERDMEAEFGEAYRRYMQHTGMFLPRLLPARKPQPAAR